jgi:hypothetical protein
MMSMKWLLFFLVMNLASMGLHIDNFINHNTGTTVSIVMFCVSIILILYFLWCIIYRVIKRDK